MVNGRPFLHHSVTSWQILFVKLQQRSPISSFPVLNLLIKCLVIMIGTNDPKHSCNNMYNMQIINCTAIGQAVLALPSVYFLSSKCRHWMMSSTANFRPFLSSFRHIPPQENLSSRHKHGRWGGQNPSEMDVRTFARRKNAIWDQSLATKKLKLSRVKLFFRFVYIMPKESIL